MCVCVCVLSSCLSVPEATVLLIAEIDELYSQGSLPPLAAHESWLVLIKASLTFLSRGCCRGDIAALMQQVQEPHQQTHLYLFFFFSFLKFHSLRFILNPSCWLPDLILSETRFIPNPFGKNVLSSQGFLHRCPCENTVRVEAQENARTHT